MAIQTKLICIGIAAWASCVPYRYQAQAPAFSRLLVEIHDVESARGSIHIALYDREEAFSKSLTPCRLQILPVPPSRRLHVQIDSLLPGRYALAAYHDENGNNDLDKNMLGIPKEAYGFSNNPRAKWSAPRFEETAFELRSEPTRLRISVKKWKDR